MDVPSGNVQPAQPPEFCSICCGVSRLALVVCQSPRPGNSTGAGPPDGVVRPPHAEVRPWVLSARETAAPGATVIDVGDVITCWEPAAVPLQGPPGVHEVPGARITVFDVPGGSIYSMERAPNGRIYFSDASAIYRLAPA